MTKAFIWTIIFALAMGVAIDSSVQGMAFAFGLCSALCLCASMLLYLQGPPIDREELERLYD